MFLCALLRICIHLEALCCEKRSFKIFLRVICFELPVKPLERVVEQKCMPLTIIIAKLFLPQTTYWFIGIEAPSISGPSLLWLSKVVFLSIRTDRRTEVSERLGGEDGNMQRGLWVTCLRCFNLFKIDGQVVVVDVIEVTFRTRDPRSMMLCPWLAGESRERSWVAANSESFFSILKILFAVLRTLSRGQ